MKIIRLFTCALLLSLAACSSHANKQGGYSDTTAVNRIPADTFKTDSTSSTNGPDNARPVDTGKYSNDINYQKSLSSTGTGNSGIAKPSVNSANTTTGVSNVNNNRHDTTAHK